MFPTTHRCDPARLNTAVLEEMERAIHAHGDRIEVSVSPGGIVTLTGTVRSPTQRHRVASAMWTAPGVEQVINLLRVEH
jgi:osmotically-inducible protein OsmY